MIGHLASILILSKVSCVSWGIIEYVSYLRVYYCFSDLSGGLPRTFMKNKHQLSSNFLLGGHTTHSYIPYGPFTVANKRKVKGEIFFNFSLLDSVESTWQATFCSRAAGWAPLIYISLKNQLRNFIHKLHNDILWLH